MRAITSHASTHYIRATAPPHVEVSRVNNALIILSIPGISGTTRRKVEGVPRVR